MKKFQSLIIGDKQNQQHLLIINGYQCTISVRKAGHGYSKKDNYELNITYKQLQRTTPKNYKLLNTNGSKKLFWCITTDLGNFMCRRQGKSYITGNCHGSFQGEGKIVDVGWDNWGTVMNIKSVIDFCNEKEIYCPDHHKVI